MIMFSLCRYQRAGEGLIRYHPKDLKLFLYKHFDALNRIFDRFDFDKTLNKEMSEAIFDYFSSDGKAQKNKRLLWVFDRPRCFRSLNLETFYPPHQLSTLFEPATSFSKDFFLKSSLTAFLKECILQTEITEQAYLAD